MDQIIERYEGGIRIADDIIIYGKDNEEYGRWLHNIMQVAQ